MRWVATSVTCLNGRKGVAEINVTPSEEKLL